LEFIILNFEFNWSLSLGNWDFSSSLSSLGLILKALLQRVIKASVTVDGQIVGRIGPGLVALVGVAAGDTPEDAQYLAHKTAGLRIFSDSEGKFNLSVQDIKGSVLAVSQFTLLADARKGRRPSFTDAAPPAPAEALFSNFVTELQSEGLEVETGRFQTHMLVEIHNDGPVTIALDSRDKIR
jgi:D-tyrosyl-tRNA(Tyr) deacylase